MSIVKYIINNSKNVTTNEYNTHWVSAYVGTMKHEEMIIFLQEIENLLTMKKHVEEYITQIGVDMEEL